MERKSKKFLKISKIVSALMMLMAIVAGGIVQKNKQLLLRNPEIAQSMTYEQFEDGDEEIEGTNNVQFSAFFLRDLDGDGYAEKLKGSCKEIGKQDTLYMDLNVLTSGYLKDAKIEIQGQNFYLATVLPKDNELKNSYIGSNIKTIEFNQLNNGTQKTLMGLVKSGDYAYDSKKREAIDNNINNYSRDDNKIVLTGTYYESESAEGIAIRKEINLNMDWYGTTEAEITSLSQNKKNLDQTIDEEMQTITLDFTVNTAEKKKELYIYSNYVKGTIPELNGYAPIQVKQTSGAGVFNYDEETKVFTITKTAETDETGIITYSIGTSNIYGIQVIYPLEAYQSLGEDTVTLKIPVETYYEGYNNTNTEFSNPYKSNIAKATIVANYKKPEGTAAIVDVTVGKYVNRPTSRYIVSKEKPLKIYNGISEGESNDNYIVKWHAETGTNGESTGLILKETKNGETQKVDQFIKTDSTEDTMEDITTNIGIYFSNVDPLLKEEGWIKVYDEETDELIATFTKQDWNNYSSTNPYKYKTSVKHIRVETSETNANSSLSVYNIKTLDDAYITDNYTKEQFDELSYIKSELSGYLGESYINTDTHQAKYEAPYSVAEIKLSNNTISTQLTEKNEKIIITAQEDESTNKKGWYNGSFLVKIPTEILTTEINSVTINNSNVQITSYELIEEDGNKFIKINTANKNSSNQSYTITIDTNTTPDPRSVTVNRTYELYATNEAGADYYYKAQDIYDVNNNLNTEEQINKTTTNISLVSPNSLLTNQTITEYDEKGSIAVSPQVADVTPIYANVDNKENEATIGVQLKNNYSSEISEVLLLGKIPFEGNTYAISGGDLKSDFTTKMKSAGIQIPEELEGKVTVYYSENENPSRYLNIASNGWKTADQVTDWNKIKTYVIDFGETVINPQKEYVFYYTIALPNGIEFNKVAYAHHGIYFALHTEQGKYRTQTEPNKVGIRIAEKYNLELTKYQTGKDKKVAGATYSIIEEGAEEGKTAVTDANGVLTINDLYAEKTYIIKEIKSPTEYELNSNEVEFVGHVNQDTGELTVEKKSGTTKGNITVTKAEGEDYKANIQVEDEAKGKLKITKTEEGTNTKLAKVVYKITGEGLPESGKRLSTNSNGEATLIGIKIGAVYTLEEVKADGYYLASPVKFRINNSNGSYNVEITEGTVKTSTVTEEDNFPIVNLELENEKIPTYNLKVIKEDEDGNKLGDAQFIISGEDENFQVSRISNENGEFNVEGLYQHIEGKYITGKYTISEFKSPKGYVNNNEEITFVVSKNQSNELEVNVENKDKLSTLKDATVDGNTVTITIMNKPLFKLTKIDADTKEPLANIKFIIKQVDEYGKEVDFAKDVDENYVGTKDENNQYVVTTNENGIISLPLPNGNYKAIEISAPVGYEQDGISKYFSISSNEEEVVVEDDEDNTTETLEINYIEDLIDLSNNIINGNKYEGTKVVLKKTLDFNEDSSYRDATSTTYGDYNGDETTNTIKEECTTGKGFKGIGQFDSVDSNIYFSGVFDGNGNEIRNIYINDKTSRSIKSLFGYIKNAKIKNLGITGEISGGMSTAGFVTLSENITIYNCYNKATISGGYIAGIIGGYDSSENGKIIIKKCYNEGDLLGNNEKGGIAVDCDIDELIIDSCYNNGRLDQSSYIGGIYGGYYNPKKIQIKNSYNTSNIDGNNLVGGIIGDARSGEIEIDNCYNLGNIIGTNEVGGIAGKGAYKYNSSSTNFTIIKNCYNIGNVSFSGTNGSYIGGIVGAHAEEISNCYNMGNVTGRSQVGGINGGCVTKISNCYNLGNVKGISDIGGINGYDIKEISNCYNIGNIIAIKGPVGGIIGRNVETTVSNCYNSGTITGTEYMGGIIGAYGNTITDVYNEGKLVYDGILSGNTYIGGIVGYCSNSSNISNAYVNIENQQQLNGTINGNNGYNDTITNAYYLNGITATNYQGTSVTKEELASNEFFEQLNVNDVWEKLENDAPTIKGLYLKTKAVSELTVENNLLRFNITTDIEELNGVKGGTITGEDATPYETVTYGENSTKEIKIIPDNGYKITKVTVNGEDYSFTANDDGSYTMPLFENMTENKHIVVAFSAIKNEVTINKIDSITKEKIGKAKFKIDQQRGNTSVNNVIGSLTGNSEKYTIIEPTENEVTSEVLGALTNNGTYYFIEQDGKYIPNNASRSSTTTANSYLEIDLTNKEGNYVVVVNAEMNNTKNMCKGFAKVTENTTAPRYNDSDLMFNLQGTAESQDYNSIALEGGRKYYLHLGYYRYYSSWDQSTGYMTINSIKVFGAKTTEKEFNFINNEGKYESTNQDKADTISNSYIPIDLTNNTGKYRLNLNATLSGNGKAYATITESTDKVDSNYSIRRIINTSYSVENRNYSIDLQGGKMYYLHLGYEKQDNTVTGTDTFTINSVSIYNISNNLFSTEFTTNELGQAKLQLPYGNYTITELEAPNGYEKLSQPVNIEFKQDGTNEFNIENTKLGNVIVHHYLKDKNGTYTTTKLAEDEMMQDKVGEKYSTKPNLDITGYTLEKDISNNYVVPSNSYGTYTDKDIEVNYYYEETEIPLIVHHYIEGTEVPVPLKSGENAQDVTGSGQEGEEYTTNSITNQELAENYELVEVPENASGTYEGNEVIVTYYYKLVKRNLTIVKYDEDRTTPLPGAKFEITTTRLVTEGEQEVEETVLVGEYTTNEQGRIDVTLEVGKYSIVETHAPDGYEKDETVHIVTITRETTEAKIEIKNEKKRGTVTVHYYVQNADGTETTTPIKLRDGSNAEDLVKNGIIGESYATSPHETPAEYYELVSATPENSSGEYIEGNIEVTYYYKLKDYGYTVEYYYDNVKDNSKTENEEAEYAAEIKTYTDKIIEGYKLDKTENLPLTISSTPENNIIKIYYVKRSDLQYTVNYLEKGTNEVIHEAKTEENKTYQEVINTSDEVITIAGYNYDSADKESITIDTDNTKNVINLYYTKKDASLVIKYVDINTEEEIATRDEQTGKVGDSYTTTPKVIEDYTVVEERLPSNASGTLTEEETTVIYYYAKNTKVTVKYIDKVTGEEIPEKDEQTQEEKPSQETIEGHEGESYTTQTKDFTNYVLIEEPTNKSGTMTAEPIEVIYYYAYVSAGVIEKHIDDISGEILYNEVHKGNEGDPYSITSKTFEGYDLVETKLPENAEGTMKQEAIEVIYYYSYRTKVTTKHIDKITGEEIPETDEETQEEKSSQEVQEGHEGDSYKAESKTFEGYDLIETELPENAEGIMTKEPIEVKYYYVYKSAGVIENHYDEKTKEKLAEEKVYKGHEGDEYETKEKEIEGYKIVEEKYPENAKGKMAKEAIRVDYYYAKEAEVRVKYIDIITGEEIAESSTIPGYEGKTYNTDKKAIEGYELVEVPKNAEGRMTQEGTEVIYYYAKPAKVIVKHIDVDTNEPIIEDVQIKGHERDEYETKEEKIKQYRIVEEKYPENTKGIMKDTIYVTYYYKKLNFNLKLDKQIISVTVNGENKQVNGDIGKIEIHRKEVSTTTVNVKYKIRVSNTGEVAGNAVIMENIPTGMKMLQSDNPEWTIEGQTAQLYVKAIEPGQTEEYDVTLSWVPGATNFGTKQNIAELIEIRNEYDAEETTTEDNKDGADMIITVSTGAKTYVVILGSTIGVLTLAGIVIKRRLRR